MEQRKDKERGFRKQHAWQACRPAGDTPSMCGLNLNTAVHLTSAGLGVLFFKRGNSNTCLRGFSAGLSEVMDVNILVSCHFPSVFRKYEH